MKQGWGYARAKPRGPAWVPEGLHSTRKEPRTFKQLYSGKWHHIYFVAVA